MKKSCLALAFLVACQNGAPAIGDDDIDQTALAETRGGYLSDALSLGTWGDVVSGADALSINDTPNPTPLLTSTSTLDDDRARTGTALSMMSYNVALLDASLFFGVIQSYRRTPTLEDRRRVIPQMVVDTNIDIILLQEVWIDEDVERFARAAEGAGYLWFAQDRANYNDGLVTLIKSSIVQGAVDFDAVPYDAQDNLENFPGPGIRRGYVAVHTTHPELGPLHVYNTHMQAFPEAWKNRLLQARQLGIAVRTEAGDDLALVGGDMNAGPYYKSAQWQLPDDKTLGAWFENTLSYPALASYGDLDDLLIMARAGDAALLDVSMGDLVVNNPDEALQTPGGDDVFCTNPAVIFTATDCNQLYFDQYAGTEYPARLDHVLVHDVGGRVAVTSGDLMFTEKQNFAGVNIEPSDHFAVKVTMVVAPQ
jgi:endonuclease/exonuclease/phosphatase family metal-dependent hydrolase